MRGSPKRAAVPVADRAGEHHDRVDDDPHHQRQQQHPAEEERKGSREQVCRERDRVERERDQRQRDQVQSELCASEDRMSDVEAPGAQPAEKQLEQTGGGFGFRRELGLLR